VIPTAELRQLSLGDPPFSTQAGSLVDTRYMSHFVTCPNADRFR
jgi:hypothetical protein